MKALKFFQQKSLSYFILSALILVSVSGIAQPGDPQIDPDNPVPIHGIAYLILGGLIVGIKRIIGNRNKN